MPSPILARADALIQRHRPRSGNAEDVPVLTDFDEQRQAPETAVTQLAVPEKSTPSFTERDDAPHSAPPVAPPPAAQIRPEPFIDDDIPVLLDAETSPDDLPPPLFPPVPQTAAPNGLFAQLHAALDREDPQHPARPASALDESHLHELCQRIEARLAIVLPRLIEEVLDDYLQERQIRDRD